MRLKPTEKAFSKIWCALNLLIFFLTAPKTSLPFLKFDYILIKKNTGAPYTSLYFHILAYKKTLVRLTPPYIRALDLPKNGVSRA